MYRSTRILFTISVFFVYSLVTACSGESYDQLSGESLTNTPPEAFKEVVIFSVNDVHGRIDNFGKVKHIIDEAREKYQSVYFVSAGDLFSGNPIVDFHPEKGYPLIDLLSKSGLDVNVIGNHEFDYGQQELAERIAQASFDFICSNVEPGSGLLPEVPDYTLIESGGVKVAFVGVVETGSRGGLPLTHPKKIQGLGFEDGNAAFGRFASLKETSGADLLVALTHQGEQEDRELLSQNGFIDLVIGGHTNQLYGYSLNSKFMVMSGKHLETLGKTTLKLFEDGRISYEFEVIDLMAEGPEDPEMLTLIAQYNNRPEFYETIGQSARDHDRRETACFYTDALRLVSEADFTIQNRGGVRANLDAGPITPFDIYTIDPFGNGFEAYELSVAALEDLLEQIDVSFSYSSDFTLERSGDQIELLQNGAPLSNDRLVTLALNDYLTNEFAELFGEPTLTYELTTADYLIQYLKTLNPGPINYEDCER